MALLCALDLPHALLEWVLIVTARATDDIASRVAGSVAAPRHFAGSFQIRARGLGSLAERKCVGDIKRDYPSKRRKPAVTGSTGEAIWAVSIPRAETGVLCRCEIGPAMGSAVFHRRGGSASKITTTSATTVSKKDETVNFTPPESNIHQKMNSAAQPISRKANRARVTRVKSLSYTLFLTSPTSGAPGAS